MHAYNKDLKTVFKELDTSENGITEEDASRRIEKYGKNELEAAKKKSCFFKFLEQFNDFYFINSSCIFSYI